MWCAWPAVSHAAWKVSCETGGGAGGLAGSGAVAQKPLKRRVAWRTMLAAVHEPEIL